MNDEFRTEADSQEFNLLDYVGLVRKYLRLILLFVALGVTAGLAYWFITPPLYRASIKMKMNHLGNDFLNMGSQVVRWNPFREEYFQTEFQIIRSAPVAERVVKDLGLAYFRDEPAQSSEESPTNIASLILDQARDDVVPEEKQDRIKMTAQGLLGGVGVTMIRDTNLINISYTSENPQRARDLANAWGKAYIEYDLESNYENNLEVYSFLSQKADDLREKIDHAVNELAKLSQEQNVVTIGNNRGTVDETALARLNESMGTAETELRESRSHLQKLRAAKPEESEEVNNDPLVKELASSLAQKTGEYQQNLKTYKPQAPKMLDLKNRIESLERQLAQERRKAHRQLLTAAEANVAAIETELNSIRASFEKQKLQSVKSKAVSESQLESMKSTISVMRRQLEMLEYRKEEVDISMGVSRLGLSEKIVVSEAKLPGRPFAPSLQRFLTVGGFFGLFLVAGLIFLMEITDRKIHTTEMLEKVTGLPTLATIPKVPIEGTGKHNDKSPSGSRVNVAFLTHSKPASPFSETYRHLRTNIQLSRAEGNSVLLLTSSVAGEGKTVSSCNLAISFAQLSKKTLLMDCDLRRPKVHKLFGVVKGKGLVNIITEANPTMHKYIFKTSIPNLHLLPVGVLPPNPAELLASKKMAHIVESLREEYEMIIIDSSPILAVTDACILARLADGVVFVTQANSTIREDATRALQHLAQNQVKPLGTVFNDFDYTKDHKYYGYKYRYRRYNYGYRYGYGYGAHEYGAEDS